MKDIKLTEDNRIEFKNGDFVLVDGVDRVKQHIRTGITGILPGTWLLDIKAGIDHFGGLSTYLSIYKAQIKNAIREVWGVSLLKNFVFDDSTENYNVQGIVLVNNENLNFNEDITWK